MTNNEIPKNDQIRMTKPATAQLRAIGHSGFGFLSTFDIRHSSFNDLRKTGSWSQRALKKASGLSKNRPFVLAVVLDLVLDWVAWIRGRGRRARGRSGSWSQCMRKKAERGLSMNRNSQTRISNDEIRRNTEIRMTNGRLHTRAPFDIRASDFFRHLSFVIRHSTTGSWSQSTVTKP